ncbi:hypothetical protein BEH_07890 [Priestia filamentosa]|uniref:Uncharacterized protein n=1 Tax=Priestia filamentosa TaxID=1402861 RepID=A0A0H4KD28_9BACI|nr:hypothetical protein [Priestia filamentosa]AKO92027.1 hypothetical protein BEH_07890 [Priestia filamentosa]
MSMEYSLLTLKNQKRNVQERLKEISEGQYDKFDGKSVKKLETELEHKLRDLEFAIEYIEDYNVEF